MTQDPSPPSHAIQPAALVRVMAFLDLKDRGSAAQVNKDWHQAAQHPSLWETLDLKGRQDAGLKLKAALDSTNGWVSTHRQHLRHVNLEFGLGIDDDVLSLLAGVPLLSVNLNACQKVTERGLFALLGVETPAHLLEDARNGDLANPPLPLQSLKLYWNLNVRNGTLHALAARCPRLTHLSLSGCQSVTDLGVMALAKGCPLLTDLDLTRCMAVTDVGFVAAARGLPRLKVLRLYACTKVTDAAVKQFGRLPELQVLDLTGAITVTSEGVAPLGACRRMRELVLTWCIGVGDPGVEAVAGGCHDLRLLSLHGNQTITDRSVNALAASCPALHTLDLSGCTSVQRRGRDYLQTRFSALTHFIVHT